VGSEGARIDALVNLARTITADEADTVVAESFLPIVGDASRVSVLAAAAYFLNDDLRAASWREQAAAMAAHLQTSDCQSLENAMSLSLGALSFRLAHQPVPEGFSDVTFYGQFRPAGCSGITYGYVTQGAVNVVTPGASLDAAIHDGEMMAIYLEEYLWFYPPGFFCAGIDDPDHTPIDKNR
jgi:hypothetical protein